MTSALEYETWELGCATKGLGYTTSVSPYASVQGLDTDRPAGVKVRLRGARR